MDNYFWFFVLILLIIGIFLLTAYSMISEANSDAPAGSTLSRAILGIYSIGLIFIVFAVMYMFFALRYDKCNVSNIIGKKIDGAIFYLTFMFILGVLMLTFGAIIKSQGSTSDSNAVTMTTTILVLGVIQTTVVLTVIGYKVYGAITSSKKTKKFEDIELDSFAEGTFLNSESANTEEEDKITILTRQATKLKSSIADKKPNIVNLQKSNTEVTQHITRLEQAKVEAETAGNAAEASEIDLQLTEANNKKTRIEALLARKAKEYKGLKDEKTKICKVLQRQEKIPDVCKDEEKGAGEKGGVLLPQFAGLRNAAEQRGGSI